VKHNFGDQGSPDYDCACEEHDEDGWAVAGIGKAVIKPATLAARTQGQKPGKQAALAAAWTGASQASGNSP